MSALWSGRSPRERVLILLGVVVVAVAIWMLMSPGGTSGRGLMSANEARGRYQDGLKRKGELDADIKRVRPALDTMMYSEPSEKVVAVVLKQLMQHAQTAGVHLREVKPLRPRQVAGTSRVTLTVRFTSEFAKVVPFLYAVEDPTGKLVVEKLNVSASDPKTRLVDIEVQVALYAAGSPAPVGGSGKT